MACIGSSGEIEVIQRGLGFEDKRDIMSETGNRDIPEENCGKTILYHIGYKLLFCFLLFICLMLI